MNPVAESALAAEARARVLIDGQLTAAGWVVQDTKDLNLSAGQGVARRGCRPARSACPVGLDGRRR